MNALTLLTRKVTEIFPSLRSSASIEAERAAAHAEKIVACEKVAPLLIGGEFHSREYDYTGSYWADSVFAVKNAFVRAGKLHLEFGAGVVEGMYDNRVYGVKEGSGLMIDLEKCPDLSVGERSIRLDDRSGLVGQKNSGELSSMQERLARQEETDIRRMWAE